MKIRKGFVSNSSSSSFVLEINDEFPDIISVAKHMLKDLFEAWKEFDSDNGTEHHQKRLINRRIRRLESLDREHFPIGFHSTNYDTYIQYLGDNYIYVDTCNNIDWSAGYKNVQLSAEKQKELGIDFNYGEIDIGSDLYEIDFYFLNYGLTITRKEDYKFCKKCWQPEFWFDGQFYCLKCDYNKLIRGYKIQRILDKLNKKTDE